MKRVWVLGSSNIDMTYRVASIPPPGNTVEASDCFIGTGGKGANQAFAIAHWGIDVSFVGALGDDEYGDTLLARLVESGINADNVRRIPKIPSGSAIIFVNPEGENCIVVHPGANHAVPANILDEVGLNSGDILVCQLEVNLDAVQRAFELAESRQVTTILNPSPFKEIGAEILRSTSIIVANVHEAEAMGGIAITDEMSAKRCARAIQEKGPRDVVLTLGSRGAILATPSVCYHVPGIPVRPVDTQGAGDAFLGSFISKVAAEADEATAMAFANAVAAFSVTQSGTTQTSMPPKDDPLPLKETSAREI